MQQKKSCARAFYSPGRSPDRGCRRVILKDRQITGLKAASFLNVRVAHEIKGCADQVLPFYM